MKTGTVPYWPCGGDVLTRALDATGRLVTRPVATREAASLIAFYGENPESAALKAAVAKARDWARAAG